jgi:hypothetical protein
MHILMLSVEAEIHKPIIFVFTVYSSNGVNYSLTRLDGFCLADGKQAEKS